MAIARTKLSKKKTPIKVNIEAILEVEICEVNNFILIFDLIITVFIIIAVNEVR